MSPSIVLTVHHTAQSIFRHRLDPAAFAKIAWMQFISALHSRRPAVKATSGGDFAAKIRSGKHRRCVIVLP
jgi:hypothetical protein